MGICPDHCERHWCTYHCAVDHSCWLRSAQTSTSGYIAQSSSQVVPVHYAPLTLTEVTLCVLHSESCSHTTNM